MNWEEVLKRDDIVGGDLETQEDGNVYRGPIESIRIEGDLVYIESPWMARMPLDRSEGWKVWYNTTCYVNVSIHPNDIGNRRLQFNMPMLGFGVIFPKGGSKLDPAKVEGLEVAAD